MIPMQLLAPDILADAKGLSVPLCISGLVVGVAVWLLGWRCHRFWLVLVTTVLGGLYGLSEGPTFRAQPLVAAVLLAIAAGVLALALVRLVAFAAGGFAFLAAAQTLGPSADQALTFFLAGGLMGLLLFRLWVMALTSFGGALLIGYAGLCLADSLGKVDAADWAERSAALLNWGCGALALVGLGVQLFLNRKKADAGGKKGKGKKSARREEPDEGQPAPGPSLWRWGGELFRQAG
jgi:hypothetical protein